MVEIVAPTNNECTSDNAISKATEWQNSNNKDFYENVTADELRQFAKNGGLASGCDVDIIDTYWKSANSILEVGAGYGRVIDTLLRHNYSKPITAIERSDYYYKHLKNKYKDNDNIEILNLNILESSDSRLGKYDLILLLWSGLAEFSPVEQQKMLLTLSQLLTKNGCIILDTLPPETTPLLMVQNQSQTFKMKYKNTSIDTYSMTVEEVNKYAIKANLSVVYIHYQSDKGRNRLLHVLC